MESPWLYDGAQGQHPGVLRGGCICRGIGAGRLAGGVQDAKTAVPEQDAVCAVGAQGIAECRRRDATLCRLVPEQVQETVPGTGAVADAEQFCRQPFGCVQPRTPRHGKRPPEYPAGAAPPARPALPPAGRELSDFPPRGQLPLPPADSGMRAGTRRIYADSAARWRPAVPSASGRPRRRRGRAGFPACRAGSAPMRGGRCRPASRQSARPARSGAGRPARQGRRSRARTRSASLPPRHTALPGA